MRFIVLELAVLLWQVRGKKVGFNREKLLISLFLILGRKVDLPAMGTIGLMGGGLVIAIFVLLMQAIGYMLTPFFLIGQFFGFW